MEPESVVSLSSLLKVLWLGELALGTFEAGGECLVKKAVLRVGLDETVSRVVNDEMDFGLAPFCSDVELCLVQIRMEVNEVVIFLVDQFLGFLPEC